MIQVSQAGRGLLSFRLPQPWQCRAASEDALAEEAHQQDFPLRCSTLRPIPRWLRLNTTSTSHGTQAAALRAPPATEPRSEPRSESITPVGQGPGVTVTQMNMGICHFQDLLALLAALLVVEEGLNDLDLPRNPQSGVSSLTT
jgi:hypothetical protein